MERVGLAGEFEPAGFDWPFLNPPRPTPDHAVVKGGGRAFRDDLSSGIAHQHARDLSPESRNPCGAR